MGNGKKVMRANQRAQAMANATKAPTESKLQLRTRKATEKADAHSPEHHESQTMFLKEPRVPSDLVAEPSRSKPSKSKSRVQTKTLPASRVAQPKQDTVSPFFAKFPREIRDRIYQCVLANEISSEDRIADPDLLRRHELSPLNSSDKRLMKFGDRFKSGASEGIFSSWGDTQLSAPDDGENPDAVALRVRFPARFDQMCLREIHDWCREHQEGSYNHVVASHQRRKPKGAQEALERLLNGSKALPRVLPSIGLLRASKQLFDEFSLCIDENITVKLHCNEHRTFNDSEMRVLRRARNFHIVYELEPFDMFDRMLESVPAGECMLQLQEVLGNRTNIRRLWFELELASVSNFWRFSLLSYDHQMQFDVRDPAIENACGDELQKHIKQVLQQMPKPPVLHDYRLSVWLHEKGGGDIAAAVDNKDIRSAVETTRKAIVDGVARRVVVDICPNTSADGEVESWIAQSNTTLAEFSIDPYDNE